MGKITLSVCKVYRNTGRFRFHRKKTKKAWKHYFVDLEEWNFCTEWVDSITAQFLKLKKHYKRWFICVECHQSFFAYVKKGTQEMDCPYCPEDED